jgi:hypothetical protein
MMGGVFGSGDFEAMISSNGSFGSLSLSVGSRVIVPEMAAP